jgi:N-acetylneuraminic acid mutarotase
MKRLGFLLIYGTLTVAGLSQNVGIGTSAPHGSALLDISSTSKGILFPRMTTAQRNAIAGPAIGLQILNTDDNCIDRFDGNSWIKTCGSQQVGTTTLGPNLVVQRTDLPVNAVASAAFVVGNKAYFTTGLTLTSTQLWELDGTTLQWTRKADFPAGFRGYATAFGIGTKGYVGMGSNGSTFYKDWWEYDPGNNTWTRRADYPGAGSEGCYAFVIGSKGYAGTGRATAGDVPVDFWEYDPVFNVWTRKADMPNSAPGLPAWGGYFRGVGFSVAGKGYGALGYNSFSGCSFCARTAQLLEYDPVANTWARKADYPAALSGPNSWVGGAAFVVGNNAYVGAMLGESSLYRYTPSSNTWTKMLDVDGAPLSSALGFSLGNSGFLAGGLAGNNPSLRLWEYRTEPTQVPVISNTSSPSASQVNDGIWTRRNQEVYLSTIGNVGIGDNAPAAKLSLAGKLKVADGSQGAGKYLQSDANGVATWQNLPAGVWTQSGNNISNTNSGFVGIGTSTPNGRLQFSNAINSRTIVLNESVNNEHNYFGFGINNFTLRYQIADPAQSHVFFAGNAANATSSNELLRIRGNGNVGIGQSNPNAPLQFATDIRNRKLVLFDMFNNDHQFFGMGINTGLLRYQVAVTGDAHVFFAGTSATTSNELFRIQGNGNAILAGVLTQNSDARLKKNVEPIAEAGALLAQLHGYRYQWKDENADAEKQLGLLAQEVQKVLPELVKEGENGKLGVNYSGLIPVLLEALKAEQSRNDLQQAMIALQQARFEKQQAEIEALKEILKRVKK